MVARFLADTAVEPRGAGRSSARMDRGWWIQRGPNGGYVAAVILRALTRAVDDPERTPRSLTVHYQAPPAEGAVEVVTEVARTGRSLTSLGARLEQDGTLVATAQAAFARGRPSLEFCDLRPPEVPGPDHCPPEGVAPQAIDIPIRERYETRWALGDPPFSDSGTSTAGGWIRLREPAPIDHALIVALTDAWIPPVFARTAGFVAVPTVDLTVHFRSPIPPLAEDAFLLTVFTSRVATDGFVEEDGEVWTADGVLLAQSRQLAMVVPVTG
ncbi:thioesterase family protein [soil metagenome]